MNGARLVLACHVVAALVCAGFLAVAIGGRIGG